MKEKIKEADGKGRKEKGRGEERKSGNGRVTRRIIIKKN